MDRDLQRMQDMAVAVRMGAWGDKKSWNEFMRQGQKKKPQPADPKKLAGQFGIKIKKQGKKRKRLRRMAVRSETVELIIKARQTGEKVVKSVKQQFVQLKNTIFNVRTALLAVAAAYAGIRIGKELIEKSDVQAKAVAKLHTALVSMGRYTPELEAGLLDTASALQEVTNYGDEATIAGQAFLTTYKDITDDLLPRSSKTMLDLAALMGGDTVQAANMLGKASMGMTGELRRAGITVDENTFKLRGYAGVLEEIEAQVPGSGGGPARSHGQPDGHVPTNGEMSKRSWGISSKPRQSPYSGFGCPI